MGRRLNSPHVPWLVQCQPEKPEFFIFAERNAVHYLRSDVAFLRETFQPNAGSDFQGATESHTAPLRVYDDRRTRFGKRMSVVETRQSDRDFAGDSGTTPDMRHEAISFTLSLRNPRTANSADPLPLDCPPRLALAATARLL